MTLPQHEPQHMDLMAEEIDRVLREGLARPKPRPVAAASRPPASPAAAPRVEKWGPSTAPATSPEATFPVGPNYPQPNFSPRDADGFERQAFTTPLQLLSQVAENTAALHEALEALVTKITGEQAPPKRLRNAPRKGSGLLPAISHLAHDIDAAHSELARLINHVARQL